VAALELDGPLDQLPGLRVLVELAVNAGHDRQQPRLHQGLIGELLVDAMRATFEDLPHRRVAGLAFGGHRRLPRIDLGEEPAQKLRHLTCRGRFAVGSLRLEGTGDEATDQGHQQEGAEAEGHGVATRQLAQPIERARRPGEDRLETQETFHVVGQRGGRRVALLAVAGDRLGGDPGEVAAHRASQSPGISAAQPGFLVERLDVERVETAHQSRRVFRGDATHHLQETVFGVAEREHADEQLVEHHAERVDVGPGVDVGGVAAAE
jgi:hypothetical protein